MTIPSNNKLTVSLADMKYRTSSPPISESYRNPIVSACLCYSEKITATVAIIRAIFAQHGPFELQSRTETVLGVASVP